MSEVFKFKRLQDRIYTITDFKDGEEIIFFNYPERPQAKALGYILYQSIETGHIRLIKREEIKSDKMI